MHKTKKTPDSTKLVHVIKISSFYLINEEREQASYFHEFEKKILLIQTLSAVMQDSINFEIRVLFEPGNELSADPKIETFLILRAIKMTKSDFEKKTDNVFNLLLSTFELYDFEMVEVKKHADAGIDIPWKNIVEIRRVVDNITLGIPEEIEQKPIGFISTEKTAGVGSENMQGLFSVQNVCPFTIKQSPFNILFKQLIKLKSRSMISMLLTRRKCSNRLKKMIGAQVLLCERYINENLMIKTGEQKIYPSLLERYKYIRDIQAYLLNLLSSDNLQISFFIGYEGKHDGLLPEIFTGYLKAKDYWGVYRRETDKSEWGEQKFESVKRIYNEEIFYPRTSDPDYFSDVETLRGLVGIQEAASVFSFPILLDENLEGINIKRSRKLHTFEHFKGAGVDLGYSLIGQQKRRIKIFEEDRKRHMYIVGQTGTGKTTLIKNMIMSDINNGNGVCLFDPHGDLYEEVINSVPQKRIKDVVLVDLADTEYPVGINLLEYETEAQRYFITQEMSYILKKLVEDEYGVQQANNMIGPIFFQHVKMNLLLVMSDKNISGTLMDFYEIFQGGESWRRWLPLKLSDTHLKNWVNNTLPRMDYTRPTSDNGVSMGQYITSKFEPLLFDPMMRTFFSTKKSTINFREVMDEGKILLVNLSKGELSQNNSRFLGLIILAKLQSEALQRINLNPHSRKNFYIYIDEFQNVTTENLITLLSEGRKFGISLILANQFIHQIPELVHRAIFGNVGTIASFRTGMEDAEILERKFYPYIRKNDFVNLPNWTAYTSTMKNGQPIRPFSLMTDYFSHELNQKRIMKIYEASRNKYAVRELDLPTSDTLSAEKAIDALPLFD